MAIFCKKLMVRSANSEPESTPLVSYFYTINCLPDVAACSMGKYEKSPEQQASQAAGIPLRPALP